MSSIEKNRLELNKLQDIQQRPLWVNELHPLGKLLLSVLYIVMIASVHKYDISRLILLSVYPFVSFVLADLSIKEGIYRMRLILPLVVFVGVFNPFFDRQTLFYIGGLGITGGVVSMVTLVIKGLCTVLSAYILIATTSIDDICYGMRCLHIPKTLVVVIMLIYRYFDVMALEAARITTAYRLRAPKQKGIHYSAWGTLVGQWLLRSMDRAEIVYESMQLRGFRGEFATKKRTLRTRDIVYPLAWGVVFIVIRFIL